MLSEHVMPRVFLQGLPGPRRKPCHSVDPSPGLSHPLCGSGWLMSVKLEDSDEEEKRKEEEEENDSSSLSLCD